MLRVGAAVSWGSERGQARVSRDDLAYYAREPFFADFVQVHLGYSAVPF